MNMHNVTHTVKHVRPSFLILERESGGVGGGVQEGGYYYEVGIHLEHLQQ